MSSNIGGSFVSFYVLKDLSPLRKLQQTKKFVGSTTWASKMLFDKTTHLTTILVGPFYCLMHSAIDGWLFNAAKFQNH